MKDYATFLMFGALCVAACAGTDEGSSAAGAAGTTGATGAATPASGSATAANSGMMGAAMSTPSSTPSSSTGGAGKPAATTTSMNTMASTATTSSMSTTSGAAGKPAAASGSAGAAPSSSGAAGSSGTAGSSGSAAAGPAPMGSFRAAYQMALTTMCTSCHMTGGIFSSPDLSSMDKAYDSLVDKDASTMAPGACTGKGKLVTPGNCETSIIYQKITEDMPMCGRHMPLSSDSAPQRVPQEGVDALCAWIKAGAKKD